MPICIEADEERRTVIATATGDLTFAAFSDFIRSVRIGERRSWMLLFDMTNATSAITSEQVRSLAANVGSALRIEGTRGAVAIVAGADVLFGVMRMYQILCEQEGVDTIRVFRTRLDAEGWLRQ
jgi:hypothetical protein